MQLDVTALKEEIGRAIEMPIAVTFDIAELGGDAGAGPVHLRGEAFALAAPNGIMIQFRLRGHIPLQCARCLQPFTFPLNVVFTEEFREGQPEGDPSDLEVDPETGASFVRYQGNHIMLEDILRQHILLALPVKPLCKSECAGLCPYCGQNQNLDRCLCRSEDLDPRLQPLEELRRRLEIKSE